MTPFVCCVSLCLLGTLIFSPSAEGAVVARSRCPSGWFFYKSNCYGYFRFKLSWAEAEFECQSYGHGAHLASILDDAEGNIIASHISAYPKTSDVWLGLHDPEQITSSGMMLPVIQNLFLSVNLNLSEDAVNEEHPPQWSFPEQSTSLSLVLINKLF
ncbi:regenerating islet-derived protein 4-like isoform X2 [Rhinatrema bivittatum]|uniref:regenerating islet-derived protein 4-like isoform X2 n=1 Tax=Rhinatrema bivittatum TaxID=194408 RepID=UPI00112ABCEB|nr:regenerating islet-derived protein 4-like isoform X2 [Rhinatrema bivittatum]